VSARSKLFGHPINLVTSLAEFSHECKRASQLLHRVQSLETSDIALIGASNLSQILDMLRLVCRLKTTLSDILDGIQDIKVIEHEQSLYADVTEELQNHLAAIESQRTLLSQTLECIKLSDVPIILECMSSTTLVIYPWLTSVN
jgi:hypothetical protein